MFPGVVFPKRNPPVQNLGIGGTLGFFWGYSRDRVEFSRLNFFFHPPLFCVNKSGATFPVPVQTPSLRDFTASTGRPGGERS